MKIDVRNEKEPIDLCFSQRIRHDTARLFLSSKWIIRGIILASAVALPLVISAQQQPVRCEDQREQLAEYLQMVHNERVVKELQIAALQVALRRLGAENAQLKAKLKELEKKDVAPSSEKRP